jgi:hypothetical protein
MRSSWITWFSTLASFDATSAPRPSWCCPRGHHHRRQAGVRRAGHRGRRVHRRLADLGACGLASPLLVISDGAAGLIARGSSRPCPPRYANAAFGETRRRATVLGRLPGETSCISLVWAVLDRSSRGARGFIMTPPDCDCSRTCAAPCSNHPPRSDTPNPPPPLSPPPLGPWPNSNPQREDLYVPSFTPLVRRDPQLSAHQDSAFDLGEPGQGGDLFQPAVSCRAGRGEAMRALVGRLLARVQAARITAPNGISMV